MYFPYLRGKQFELIALRDLCSIFSDDILKTSPVIEPVKSTSTFKSTLKELASKNVNFNIIINPRVGDLKGKHQEIVDVVSESLQGYENFQLAVILDDKSERNIQTFIDFIGALNFNFNGVTLIHNSEVSGNNIELLTTNLNIVYNLIYFSKTSRRYYREFAQNTRVSLDDYFKEMPKNADYLDLESVTFSGSLSQDNLVVFNLATKAFDDQMSELGQQYGQARQLGDTTRMNAIEAEYMSLDGQKTDYVTQYAFDHPNQVLSAYIILSNSYQYELDMLDSITMAFSPEISQSKYVKQLQEHVATLKRSSVGQPFIDFTMDDINGNPIMLSSVIGKNYVLVDFWASWCSPCRAENPNVVAAFEKYHDKGFDVYGVSFDKDHDGWINAIADDQLAWTQVSDLKYWNCAAGKLYGIQSIPQNILISPEGIIIEKNLRGEDLQLKLQELLD